MKKVYLTLLSFLPAAFLASCNPTNTSTLPSSNPITSSSTVPSSPSNNTSSEKTEIHSISIDPNLKSGTVSLSVNKAKKGDVVTVTATPSKNSTLSKFTASVEGVSFASTGELTATFLMPDQDIVIGAEFNLSIGSLINVTPNDFHVVSQTFQKDQTVASGSKLEFKVTTSDDVTNDLSRYNAVLGQSFGTITADPDDSKSLLVSFENIEEGGDVFIYISKNSEFVVGEEETGYYVSYTPIEGVHIFDIDPNKKYRNAWLSVLGYVEPGYSIEKSSAGDQTLTFSSNSTYNPFIIEDQFLLDEDVTLTVSAKKVNYQKISYINEEKVKYSDGTLLDLPKFGNVGATIRLNRMDFVASESGKRLKSITLPDGLEDVVNDSSHLTFTMPDKDVEITFNTADSTAIQIQPNEGVTSTEIEDEAGRTIADALPGEKFTVTATVKDGYKLLGGKIGNTNGKLKSDNKSIEFTMPTDVQGSSVEVVLITGKEHEISIESIYFGSLDIDSRTVAAGETVKVKITPFKAHRYIEGSLKDPNNPDLKFTVFQNNAEFIMPDKDVTLTASFEALPTKTLTVVTDGFVDAKISDILISGVSSSETAIVTKTIPSNSFVIGDHLSAYLTLSERVDTASTYYTMTVTPKDGKASTFYGIPRSSTTSSVDFTSNDFIMPDSDATITFAMETKKEVKGTISKPDNTTVYATVDGSIPQYDDVLFHTGDIVTFGIGGQPAEGKMFEATIQDQDGTHPYQSNTVYYVKGDFTLTVVEVNAHTLTWKNDSNIDTGGKLLDSQGNSIKDGLNNGDVLTIKEGTEVTLSFTYRGDSKDVPFSIVIKSGDKIIQDKLDVILTIENPTKEFHFTMKEDVSVEVTPLSSTAK